MFMGIYLSMSMWVSRGVYGILWVFESLRVSMGGYGNMCGFMGVYGGLWESG